MAFKFASHVQTRVLEAELGSTFLLLLFLLSRKLIEKVLFHQQLMLGSRCHCQTLQVLKMTVCLGLFLLFQFNFTLFLHHKEVLFPKHKELLFLRVFSPRDKALKFPRRKALELPRNKLLLFIKLKTLQFPRHKLLLFSSHKVLLFLRAFLPKKI